MIYQNLFRKLSENSEFKESKELINAFYFDSLSISIISDYLQIEDIPLITECFRSLISGKGEFTIQIRKQILGPDFLVVEHSSFSDFKDQSIEEEWLVNPIIFIALQLALESENIPINIFNWLDILYSYINENYQEIVKNFILTPLDFVDIDSEIINLVRLNCLCMLDSSFREQTELALFSNKDLIKNLAKKIDARNFLHASLLYKEYFIFNFLFELIDEKPEQLLDKDNNTFLHLCSEWNYKYLEKILSIIPDINAQNVEGDTALHHAIIEMKLNVILFLIDHGAKVDIANGNNKTAMDFLDEFTSLLLFKAFDKSNIRFIEFLNKIFEGKQINPYGPMNNNSVLHIVGDKNLFEYALKLTENIDHKNINDDTPLMLACRDKKIEKQIFLLDNGADPFIKNKHNESPIDLMNNELRYYCFNTKGKVLSPAPEVFRQFGYKCGIYAVKNSAHHYYKYSSSLFNQPIPPARKNDVTPKSENSIHQLAKALNITHAGPIFEIEALAKLIEKVGCMPVIREPKNYEEFMKFIIKAIELNLPLIIPCMESFTPHWTTIIGYYNRSSENILIANHGRYESIDANVLYRVFNYDRNATHPPFSLMKDKNEWKKTMLTPGQIKELSSKEVLKGKGFFHQLQEIPLNNFYGRLIIVAPPNYDLTLLNDVELNYKNNI